MSPKPTINPLSHATSGEVSPTAPDPVTTAASVSADGPVELDAGVESNAAVLIRGYEGIRQALANVLDPKGPIGEDLNQNTLSGPSMMLRAEEVAHKPVSGFVPFTDGGWTLTASTILADIDSSSCQMTNDVAWAKIQKALESSRHFALEGLKGSRDWAEVLSCAGKDESWAPKTLFEVTDALRDISDAHPELAWGIETLLDRINQDYEMPNYDDVVDLEITALVYAPDNHRNSLGDGRHEILMFPRVSIGETYWLYAQPDRTHVDGPECSIPVEPGETVASLQEKIRAKAVEMVAWLQGTQDQALKV